jgi:hypothetical protein
MGHSVFFHQPASSEYSPANAAYVNLVPEEDIIATHEQQLAEVLALLGRAAARPTAIR